MRNNRMIAGLSTRPILGAMDRMIVSTSLGGELLIRERRKSDPETTSTDTDKTEA